MYSKYSFLWVMVFAALFIVTCSDDNTSSGAGVNDSDSNGTGDTDTDTDSDSDSDTDSDSDSDSDSNGGAGGDTTEVCDGIDNDNNGKIDDVDAGGDGICDCLHIGTIGKVGPWGEGNIFTEWLNTRSPIPATDIDDAEITPELLAGLDVIIVLRVDTAQLASADITTPAHHEFSDDEVAALDQWVRDNGGLMTTIGYQGNEKDEVVNVNKLLSPMGLGYQTEDQYLNLGGFITNWADHPITESIENIRTDNGVEPNPENGTPIGWGANDTVAMVVSDVGDGHVIVFGDEWITYDSEWQDITDQQIEHLWLNMLKWLTPIEQCQVEIPPIGID